MSTQAQIRRARKRTLREPSLHDALDGPAHDQAQRVLEHMERNGADQVRSVLHLGSGTGRLIAAMAQLRPEAQFTGVEWQETLLAHARRRHPDHEFVLADARRVDLKRQFDAIVCCTQPHLARADEPNLRRTYTRHSRPGTVLVLRVAMIPVERRVETRTEVEYPSGQMTTVRTAAFLHRRNKIGIHRQWDGWPPVADRYDLRITPLKPTVAALQRRGFTYAFHQMQGQVMDGPNIRLLAFQFHTAGPPEHLHPSQTEDER